MNQKAVFNQALGTEGLFAPLESEPWDCSKESMAGLAAPAAACLLLLFPWDSAAASLPCNRCSES